MPAIYEAEVKRAKKAGAKNPHAYATSVLQRKKVFKKGSRKLTRKGKRLVHGGAKDVDMHGPVRGLEHASKRARARMKSMMGGK